MDNGKYWGSKTREEYLHNLGFRRIKSGEYVLGGNQSDSFQDVIDLRSHECFVRCFGFEVRNEEDLETIKDEWEGLKEILSDCFSYFDK